MEMIHFVMQVNHNMLCNVSFVTTIMKQSQKVPNPQLASSKVRQMSVQRSDRQSTAPYHMTQHYGCCSTQCNA